MAHVIQLSRRCLRCEKRASVEVFNSANASQGTFCSAHGKKRLAEIESAEKAVRPW